MSVAMKCFVGLCMLVAAFKARYRRSCMCGELNTPSVRNHCSLAHPRCTSFRSFHSILEIPTNWAFAHFRFRRTNGYFLRVFPPMISPDKNRKQVQKGEDAVLSSYTYRRNPKWCDECAIKERESLQSDEYTKAQVAKRAAPFFGGLESAQKWVELQFPNLVVDDDGDDFFGIGY
ncbi:hypothetical protein P171DRAFT_237480 [Karstenula rhodostoma CBS 690.94]|uniref:Uncharacterized protein n=1 Tax=Karstenula rhodostoma CBS 690.94 TaxID=1392251 RepID=A0A9P4UDU0_9PLEO|nr:hypothetical protein P171DRAFT_237480 [Karstenula rhodostoma CBS 690.94]